MWTQASANIQSKGWDQVLVSYSLRCTKQLLPPSLSSSNPPLLLFSLPPFHSCFLQTLMEHLSMPGTGDWQRKTNNSGT